MALGMMPFAVVNTSKCDERFQVVLKTCFEVCLLFFQSYLAFGKKKKANFSYLGCCQVIRYNLKIHNI